MTTRLREMGENKPKACKGNKAFARHYTRIMAKMSQAAAAAQTTGTMLESMSK